MNKKNIYIGFDGRVLFCSNDWGCINIVGDINNDTIEEI